MINQSSQHFIDNRLVEPGVTFRVINAPSSFPVPTGLVVCTTMNPERFRWVVSVEGTELSHSAADTDYDTAQLQAAAEIRRIVAAVYKRAAVSG